jgi:hypothetical protein
MKNIIDEMKILILEVRNPLVFCAAGKLFKFLLFFRQSLIRKENVGII